MILIRADGSGRDVHPGMAFLGVPPTWYVPAQAQATPTPTLSNTLITVYTNCREVNFRAAPSTSATLLGTIQPGTPIRLDPTSKTPSADGYIWYRAEVMLAGTLHDGWIVAQRYSDYFVFDFDRSPNCTPAPTATLPPSPTSASTCQLILPNSATRQEIHLFRAPIRGNPAEQKITVANSVIIDAYAIDPLNHRLWFRRTEGIANVPAGAVLRWIQVITPPAGFILQSQGIIVPGKDFDGVKSASLERDQIEACLSNLSKANLSGHYALPPLDQVPWEMTSPLTFTHYPVSMYQTCVAFTAEHRHIHMISGFADAKGGYWDPGYHFGVDFFAPPDSVVYASGDRGLVVALLHTDETTGAAWGDYKVKEITSMLTPFAVVIRYGHLFVIYGHLQTIDPNIWVGKRVDAGTRLGTIGIYKTSNPHLHMSVMGFGRETPNAYVTWAQEIDPQNPQAPKPNQWGIPDFQRTALRSEEFGYPKRAYDFTQFFEPDPILAATTVATGAPNTLEQPILRGSIWAEDTNGLWTLLVVNGLGGKHRTMIRLGFPCEIPYSQRFPEPTGWRYVDPIITPTILPRHRSFIYYPGEKNNWTPAPADDPRLAMPAPHLQPIPTLTPTTIP
ncbi:MAG: M23 family metallopeptidase [Anaerolineales bacterium]|nr:M23 family metallopeptidase [Anaerolineales bacterium]